MSFFVILKLLLALFSPSISPQWHTITFFLCYKSCNFDDKATCWNLFYSIFNFHCSFEAIMQSLCENVEKRKKTKKWKRIKNSHVVASEVLSYNLLLVEVFFKSIDDRTGKKRSGWDQKYKLIEFFLYLKKIKTWFEVQNFVLFILNLVILF